MNNIAVFVIGVTCSGKTTLMNVASQTSSNFANNFGQIRIGEVLRAKHPPEYFKGQGAPEHSEEEALQIYSNGLQRTTLFPIVLVDGQPRKLSQVDTIVQGALNANRRPMALVLCTPEKEIRRRASARSGNDPKELLLALNRIEHDAYSLYNVLTYLHVHEPSLAIKYVDSTDRSTFPGILSNLLTLHEGMLAS